MRQNARRQTRRCKGLSQQCPSQRHELHHILRNQQHLIARAECHACSMASRKAAVMMPGLTMLPLECTLLPCSFSNTVSCTITLQKADNGSASDA